MLPFRFGRFIASFVVVTTVLSLVHAARGERPAAPPPPKQYDVVIHYRIDAAPLERLRQYTEMTRYFGSIGFVVDPDQDDDPKDVNETRYHGKIASTNVRRLLEQGHVQSLLLRPAGYQPAEDEETPVKVQLELASGLPSDRQRVFADQVRGKLASLGFQEAVGYDHRGQTRVVGTIPAGNLELLLKDIRWQPSGWLVPVTPVAELPAPLRDISPIRVTEVLPEPTGLASPKGVGSAAERIDEADPLFKLSEDLQALVTAEGENKPARMEVILAFTPGENDASWRRDLNRAAEVAIEGRLGPVVTVMGFPKQAPALAGVPIVSVVRLPRPAAASWRPVGPTQPSPQELLRQSGLERLHASNFRGRGIRVAVVDGDFRGYEQFKGKQLPTDVRYLDFTTERNAALEPDAYPSEPAGIGSGTQCALAVTVAAPEADLTLIRIDPAAPHQLEAVARLINGEAFRSDSLLQRNNELQGDANRLRLRREDLVQEGRVLFQDFGLEEAAVKRRTDHAKKVAELEQDERAFQDRQRRFLDIVRSQYELRGIQVVTSSLVWNSAYPVGGSNPLNQYFNSMPTGSAIWFQAAGNSRGQSWAGLFRDVDGDQVMAFASPESPVPAGRWTRQLNFLAWQPVGKERTPELPAKTKLRVSIQWREAHDPEIYEYGNDAYRRPLTNLRLVIVRQRDPSGTKVAADDLDVVGRSVGLPQRLDNQPASATYEQLVEFTVDPAGRYAVRVEGPVPSGTRPAGMETIRALQQFWELWPRVFVEVLDGPSRLAGRAVFLDYATDLGASGMPADAKRLITVGAADAQGKPEPFSTYGPLLNRSLIVKPTVLAYDGMRGIAGGEVEIYGASLSAPFAAGLTAAVLSEGMPRRNWETFLHRLEGRLLRAP
jgi:hypothetical protein